jgi:hypothetical protein
MIIMGRANRRRWGSNVTEQLSEHSGNQLSPPELEFGRRWRPMIDRVGGDGGQARAAKHLNWTTSTVSRDYKGGTLPTDERLFQLCHALQLSDREMLDLAVLLRSARAARRDRLRISQAESAALDPSSGHGPAASAGSGAAVTTAWPEPDLVSSSGRASVPGQLPSSGQPHGPDGWHTARQRPWFRSRGRLAAMLSLVAVPAVVAVTLVLILSGPGAPPAKPGARPVTAPGVQPVPRGAFSGLGLVSVRIPARSLSPALAAEFRQGRTAHATMVTGFVFRNREATGLCLTAVNTGAKAGKNHDPVVVGTCARTPNQIWIPLQWEVKGFRFTHLVNDQYQSMCLNADNRGGMHVSSIVQLWDCYPAGNEAWDFGDWHTAVSTGGRSYPLFARSGRLCLDADKYDLRVGTPVRLWTQYATTNQFWS